MSYKRYTPFKYYTREQKRIYWSKVNSERIYNRNHPKEDKETTGLTGWIWDDKNNWEDWGEGRDW